MPSGWGDLSRHLTQARSLWAPGSWQGSVRSPGGTASLVRQEWLAVPGSLARLQRGLGSQPAGLQLLKAPR